jgi:hypothetical protein
MSTSQITGLCEPTGSDKVSLGTLGYIRALNKQRQYDIVIKEFKQSHLSNADLARRMGKAPEVICRLLARPSNWEAETFSDLLFCISGGVTKYQVDHPFRPVQAEVVTASAYRMQRPPSMFASNSSTFALTSYFCPLPHKISEIFKANAESRAA